jgi:hypothetical protein
MKEIKVDLCLGIARFQNYSQKPSKTTQNFYTFVLFLTVEK